MKLSAQQLDQLTPEQKRQMLQQLLERSQKPAPRVLSPAQHGLWIAHKLDPERFTDHLLNAYRLRGPLKLAALERALQLIVDRHETLRTCFLEEDGEPRPQVAERQLVECLRFDIRGELDREQRAHQLAKDLVRQRFDLASGPLYRFALVTLAEDEHVLVLVIHHIVADNWSFKVLNEELEQLYSCELVGQSQTLAPLAENYGNYSARERKFLESSEYARQASFWKEQLADFKLTELPMDFPRPELEGGLGATARFQLDAATAAGFRRVGERCKASSFMTFLTAFSVLVHRYTDQDDLAIGVPVANRNDSASQAMVGFFVNTLVSRIRFTANTSFTVLLTQLRDNALACYEHSRFPFEHLVEQLNVARDMSRNPLVPLIFQSGLLPDLKLRGLDVEKCFEADYGIVRCDLEFYLVEERDGLAGTVVYNQELFGRKTIERLCSHFKVLAAALASLPDQAVNRLALLTDDERRYLVLQVNDTARENVRGHLLAAIADRVSAGAEQLAVQAGPLTLTYGELWRAAGNLAQSLRARGVVADVPVGICMERGIALAVALLGVLRAGGAYLPLDPTYPAERLAYLVQDSRTPLVLVQAATKGVLSQDSPTLSLDGELPAAPAIPLPEPLPEHLAYVIYTSGSTGKPKGAMVSHGAIYNTLAWRQRVFPLGNEDRVLQTTSFSFDASVWEFFGPLIAGATLDLSLGPGLEGRMAIPQLVREHRVTCMQLPPAWLKVFLEAEGLESLVSLRCLTTGAEPVSHSLQRHLFERLPIRFANHYGPTEAALDVTAWQCQADDTRHFAPIGQPIDNVQVYLVDRQLELKLQGRAGRLMIGGAGLARGYMGSPRLTAERFLPDPFGGRPGARLYDSGDMARWEEGQLHFLGRSDNQVKIRGFRIEINEITAALEQLVSVRQAVVMVREDRIGDKRLVAYVVAERGHDLDQALLRERMRSELPEHMIPHAFVLLDCLPLSPNGKLDLQALPLPEGGAADTYLPPSTPLECQLAEIWSQVLGVPRVGANDNFFALGGDSILAIQIIAKAAKLQMRLTPKAIFSHQTIARLAQHLGHYKVLEQQASTGAVALSPIQRWFFAQNRQQPETFNQAFLLELRQSLELPALTAALADVTAHHDSLRLRFARTPEGWQAYFGSGEGTWQIERVDLSREQAPAAAMARHAAGAGYGLDLGAGPLAQALVYHWGGSDRFLLLSVHHLVIDGYSWRILLEDLETALVARFRGRSPEFPAGTSSWQTWMGTLQADGDLFCQQRAFWREQAESLPSCEAPTGTVAAERTLTLVLESEQTRALLTEAPKAYQLRINDLLLTALARVLCARSGQDSVRIDLESHGRQVPFEQVDLSRTLGWFTSLFPLVLSLPAGADPALALKAIKEQLRAVPDDGLGYGWLRYLDPEASWDDRRAEVLFNYLGQFDNLTSESQLFRMHSDSGRGQIAPGELRPHALDIYGMVSGGQLRLHWRYNGDHRDEAEISALVAAYRDELLRLVEHCRQAPVGATPSDFPLAQLPQARLDELFAQFGRIEDLYPLTTMQQSMVYHSQLDPSSRRYIQQICCGLRGALDGARYRQAWQWVCDHHPVLRSLFQLELEQPVQLVLPAWNMAWQHLDWRDLTAEACQQRRQAFLDEERRPFALRTEPPQRFALIQVEADKHYFVWTHHHALLDGWSLPLLLAQVSLVYAGETHVVEASRPYRDHIAFLSSADLPAARAFWRQRLAGFAEPNQLPVRQGKRDETLDHANFDYRLSQERTARLHLFARNHGLTTSSLVQAAWSLLLGHYCGTRDVCFGVTVSGRNSGLEGAERMVGLFINTLPLRVSLQPGQNPLAWLLALQQSQVEALAYDWTPLTEIRAQSELESGQNLFETIVVFENYPMHEQLLDRWTGLATEDVYFVEKVEYPLVLQVLPGQELVLKFKHDPRRFSATAIARMQHHLGNLLEGLTGETATDVVELSPLDASERSRILYEWNDTAKSWEKHQTLHQLFERQVACSPDAIAVTCEGQHLAYRELAAQVRRLARALMARGTRAGDLVGVFLPRGLDMVCAPLAILEVGAAYVPMEAGWPAERVVYIADDCALAALLTHAELAASLPSRLRPLVLELDRTPLDGYEDGALRPAGSACHLAYIIFTSGSTGRPKGVILQHRPVINLIEWVNHTYAVGPGDRLLFVTSLCFDLSVYDIFGMLACGGAIHVALERDIRDPERLLAMIEEQHITFWDSAPAALNQLASFLPSVGSPDLRLVFLSGDWIPLSLVPALQACFANVKVIGLGGATEATIWSNFFPIGDLEPEWKSVPYGRPIQNAAYYILDDRLQVCAPDVPGDLYIGGECLSLGYHNQRGLSASRYLPNPYSCVPGGVLYTTGDRARWFEDGKMEFLGRRDHQVKVRGYRIELGEIECVLNEDARIREAVVLARQDQGDKRLVAYIQPEGEQVLATAELRALLAARLPEYMVPSSFVTIEHWPVTANGKLDRKRLPAPDFDLSDSGGREAVSDLERQIAQVFAAVLGVESVPVDVGFFELGGDSILAIQVISRLRAAALPLSLADLLHAQSVGELASRVCAASPSAVALAEPAVRPLSAERLSELASSFPAGSNFLPLTPVQHGMLFYAQLNPDSLTYFEQLSFAIATELDQARFRHTWELMAERHPILRTVFAVDDEAAQVVLPAVALQWRELAWPELDESQRQQLRNQELAADLRRGFDFAKQPPLRFTLFREGPARFHFCMTFHHVLLDGWSFEILLREVVEIYGALGRNQPPALPPAPPFASFVAWLQARDLGQAREFWCAHLAGLSEPTRLQGEAHSEVAIENVAHRAALTAEETTALAILARAHDLTFNTLVQGAWGLVLLYYSGRPSVLFGTTASGRPADLEGVETIVGPFLGAIPFRVDLDAKSDIWRWLQHLQRSQMEARLYEFVPLPTLREWSDMPPGTALFDIIFTFYNDPFYSSLAAAESALAMSEIRFEDENNFALNLAARATPKLEMQIKYDKHRFSESLIQRLMQNLIAFMSTLSGQGTPTLAELFDLFASNDENYRKEALDAFKKARENKPMRRRPVLG